MKALPTHRGLQKTLYIFESLIWAIGFRFFQIPSKPGRNSCADMNLQNIPCGDRVRRQVKDVLGQGGGLGLGVDAVTPALGLALAHISTLVYAF